LAFVAALPSAEVLPVGTWSEVETTALLAALNKKRQAATWNDLPNEPVLGVFTSGTTSNTQRLVLYSKANVRASQEAIFALFDAERCKRIFCYPQPYHVFGLMLGYVLAELKSCELFFCEGAYGKAAHDLWLKNQEERTLTLATPTHLLDLLEHVERGGHRPRPTYSAIIGGTAVDARIWNLARDQLLIEQPSIGYGCTEASPGVSHLPPGVEPRGDGDLGYRLPHLHTSITSEGVSIFGPSVAMAMIEAGQMTLLKDFVIRDVITEAADGRLSYGARHDLVLNRGGEKFQLERIETVIREEHALQTICVPLPHPRLGEELGIVVESKIGAQDLRPVFSTLKAHFNRGFDLDAVMFVEVLPLNANAKVDRRAAAQLFLGI
jgi:acyl-CoA synthetase (AMP-forming)/AMP-acid ligase II